MIGTLGISLYVTVNEKKNQRHIHINTHRGKVNGRSEGKMLIIKKTLSFWKKNIKIYKKKKKRKQEKNIPHTKKLFSIQINTQEIPTTQSPTYSGGRRVGRGGRGGGIGSFTPPPSLFHLPNLLAPSPPS